MNSESIGKRASLLFIVAALGCARVGGPAGPHADPGLDASWPPPPEPTRVVLLQVVEKPSDLISPGGVWTRLRDAIAGPRVERMISPSALAVDERLGLIVADTGLPGVHLFDWSNDVYRLLTGDAEHPIISPVGVAVTPDGLICVSDSSRGSIVLLTSEGEVAGEISDPGRLLRPAGLAFDPDAGELIVVDVLAHDVKRYTLEGEFVSATGGVGEEPGKFNFPTHLWRMPDGRVAVTDSLNFRVQVLASDGSPERTVGRLGDAPGCLARPKGVAVDADGNLWVVDAQFENVQAFDPEGRLLLHVGGAGHAPGQFWLPSGLAIDAENRLYVADTHNHRVQIFQIVTGLETNR